MKAFIFIMLFATTLAQADDSFHKTVKYLKGADVAKALVADDNFFDGSFESGENDCSVNLITHDWNSQNLLVFSTEKSAYLFRLFENATYKYTLEESKEEAGGEGRGWLTNVIIERGKHKIEFSLQGDMGYTVYYYKGRKKLVECDTGF